MTTYTIEWTNGQFLDRVDAESARAASVIVARDYGLAADQFRVKCANIPSFTIEIQHLDGEWHKAEKLATFNGSAWVYPSFATVAEAEAAVAETYADVLPGCVRIVSDAPALPFYHGFCHRFCVRPFTTRYNDVVYMVHDANHVSDDDIRAGHRSPVCAQFDTVQEAIAWCDAVEAGKIVSVPHESNFTGWPELEHRVTGRPMSRILNRA